MFLNFIVFQGITSYANNELQKYFLLMGFVHNWLNGNISEFHSWRKMNSSSTWDKIRNIIMKNYFEMYSTLELILHK